VIILIQLLGTLEIDKQKTEPSTKPKCI